MNAPLPFSPTPEASSAPPVFVKLAPLFASEVAPKTDEAMFTALEYYRRRARDSEVFMGTPEQLSCLSQRIEPSSHLEGLKHIVAVVILPQIEKQKKTHHESRDLQALLAQYERKQNRRQHTHSNSMEGGSRGVGEDSRVVPLSKLECLSAAISHALDLKTSLAMEKKKKKTARKKIRSHEDQTTHGDGEGISSSSYHNLPNASCPSSFQHSNGGGARRATAGKNAHHGSRGHAPHDVRYRVIVDDFHRRDYESKDRSDRHGNDNDKSENGKDGEEGEEENCEGDAPPRFDGDDFQRPVTFPPPPRKLKGHWHDDDCDTRIATVGVLVSLDANHPLVRKMGGREKNATIRRLEASFARVLVTRYLLREPGNRTARGGGGTEEREDGRRRLALYCSSVGVVVPHRVLLCGSEVPLDVVHARPYGMPKPSPRRRRKQQQKEGGGTGIRNMESRGCGDRRGLDMGNNATCNKDDGGVSGSGSYELESSWHTPYVNTVATLFKRNPLVRRISRITLQRKHVQSLRSVRKAES